MRLRNDLRHVCQLISMTLTVSAFTTLGCSDLSLEDQTEAELKQAIKGDEDRAVYDPAMTQRAGTYVDTEFGISTPLGDYILKQARTWEVSQVAEAEEYAQPRMCAHNVSRVLEMSDLPAYGDYLVPNMLNAVEVRGGLVTQLDTRDKQGFIKSLNQMFEGHLPVGALVNGCLYEDCSGEGGDGHIAIMGHTDSEGVVYLYHNNWYRPDNEGGERKPYMVSEEFYNGHGLFRQWMPTPWIRVHRDEKTHEIVDVEGLLPAIDDLDPYTGFFLTVSIVPELLQELGVDSPREFFCPEGMTPDPMLGACVTGQESTDHVFGRFSDEMVKACVDRGFGVACTTLHTLESADYTISLYRWSRGVYESLRGDDTCPNGLTLDHDLGHCVQLADEERGTTTEAFGPFSTELVERCFEWGGGNACAGGRWPVYFLKSLINH